MSTSNTPLYVHYVWSTLLRQPLIDPAWEHRLHAALAAKCKQLGCALVEVNGMPDHVHVFVRLPANRPVVLLAHDMKGSSSHLVNHVIAPNGGFRWQNTYYARTVDPERKHVVLAYVQNQKDHHANGTVNPDWEWPEEEEED